MQRSSCSLFFCVFTLFCQTLIGRLEILVDEVQKLQIKLTTWTVFYFYSALAVTNAGPLEHCPATIIVTLAKIPPHYFWVNVSLWSKTPSCFTFQHFYSSERTSASAERACHRCEADGGPVFHITLTTTKTSYGWRLVAHLRLQCFYDTARRPEGPRWHNGGLLGHERLSPQRHARKQQGSRWCDFFNKVKVIWATSFNRERMITVTQLHIVKSRHGQKAIEWDKTFTLLDAVSELELLFSALTCSISSSSPELGSSWIIAPVFAPWFPGLTEAGGGEREQDGQKREQDEHLLMIQRTDCM